MKIRVRTRTGVMVFDVDIDDKTIEDIAEEVCTDMAEKWVRSIKARNPVRARRRFVEGCLKWMYPSLLSAIVEYAITRGVQ